jgi:hypothetical protein
MDVKSSLEVEASRIERNEKGFQDGQCEKTSFDEIKTIFED